MKKALFILIALVMVGSGVAAVSAYEAHLINVTAHVENAMSVDRQSIHFGTVFPEEWLLQEFHVGTSDSFCAPGQFRVTHIDYAVYAEWKPVGTASPTPVVTDAAGNKYYAWLGNALYVGIDATDKWPNTAPVPGDMALVGPALAGPQSAQKVNNLVGTLFKAVSGPQNLTDLITVGLDVPVFEGSYNALTDMLQADGTYLPKPSHLNDPTWIIPANFPGYDPDGMDFGLDLKIQVTKIYKP